MSLLKGTPVKLIWFNPSEGETGVQRENGTHPRQHSLPMEKPGFDPEGSIPDKKSYVCE